MDIKQKSLSKTFMNRNCRSVIFGITCLEKVDQTKVAISENSYFPWHSLNSHKTDVVVYFFKVISQFLLVCFAVCVCKISDKSDEPLLSYSSIYQFYSSLGIVFSGHSVVCSVYAG